MECQRTQGPCWSLFAEFVQLYSPLMVHSLFTAGPSLCLSLPLSHSASLSPSLSRSAGVGRTGTFIAVDVMLQKLEKNEPLDIMNFVCQMRAQRASMVQTSVSLTHTLNSPSLQSIPILSLNSCSTCSYTRLWHMRLQ